ncbi:unnamed protein product [Rangifer tarandus platyrhynchus]|uniref:Uncharacterized protein n=1 Tax=Rangifer tarandus platyrhynchus TaxID=3082113 RepID=A0AC59ZNR3_RANTA
MEETFSTLKIKYGLGVKLKTTVLPEKSGLSFHVRRKHKQSPEEACVEETQAPALLLQPHSASSEFPASAASHWRELTWRWTLSSEIPWLTPHGVDRLSWDIAQIVNTLVSRASLVAQMVKNLPAMQETWVRSLDWEGPLEEEMATHSSILAGETSWTEEPGGLQSTGSQRVRHD